MIAVLRTLDQMHTTPLEGLALSVKRSGGESLDVTHTVTASIPLGNGSREVTVFAGSLEACRRVLFYAAQDLAFADDETARHGVVFLDWVAYVLRLEQETTPPEGEDDGEPTTPTARGRPVKPADAPPEPELNVP